jgi:MFS family permease
MSGVGIGALVFAPFIIHVVESQGWRVGFLCAGGNFFLLVSASALVMRSSPAEVGQPSPDGSAGQSIHTKRVSARQVLTSRRFAAIAFIAVVALVAVQILSVHLVAHATDVGVPAGLAAVALGLVGVCSVPGRLLAGLLSEHIGWRRVLSLSLFGAASSFILLLTVRSAWMLYPFVVVYGVCHGMRAVGVVGLLGRLFGTRFIGQLIGTTMGGARLVGAFAPYLAGCLFDQFGSYNIAFWVLAAILAMGGMIALKIGRQ